MAALLLSYCPSLTQHDVFSLITSSADKVGGYTYTNGSSNELGYGRLNANNALQTLIAAPTGTYTSSPYSGPDTPLQSFQIVPKNARYYLNLSTMYNSYTFRANTANATSIVVTQTGPRSAYFDFPGGSVQILAAPAGACPEGSYVFREPFMFAFSPNPASSELTVTQSSTAAPALTSPTAKPTAASQLAEPSFEAVLYDIYGHAVRTQRSSRQQAVFDVRTLPAGIYTLRVGQGKEAYSQHVQITH